jgi:hypothetical protein
MANKLLTYLLHNAPFYVDVAHDQLIQVANPKNIIALRDAIYDPDMNHYRIGLKVERMEQTAVGDRGTIEVIIPALGSLDPDRMAKMYHKSPKTVVEMKDWQIVNDAEALQERIQQGKQPVLILEDTTFYVHLRADRLEKHGEPWKTISFEDIEQWLDEETGNFYTIPYHPEKAEFVDLDLSECLEVPKDLRLLRFPSKEGLDPFGYCRETGFELEETLRWHPLVMERVAERVDWEVLGLQEIIDDNRQEQKARQERTRRTITDDKVGGQKRRQS